MELEVVEEFEAAFLFPARHDNREHDTDDHEDDNRADGQADALATSQAPIHCQKPRPPPPRAPLRARAWPLPRRCRGV